MEVIVVLIILALIYGAFQDKNSSVSKRQNKSSIHNHYTQTNIYVQNNFGTKVEAHTSKVWKELGYEVIYGERYAYKYFGREIYTENQVRSVGNQHNRYALSVNNHLSSNQKKVKSLGYTLVNKYGSKQKAKNILIDHYDFDEDTAKYATGYQSHRDW